MQPLPPKRPLLSVHILTCQRESLFLAALDSVRKQLTPECELLVTLNGPHPRLEAMLKPLQSARFKLLCSPLVSRAGARNQAFQKAQGKYIHYLDDDVEVPQDFFSKVIFHLKDSAELDVVGGPNLTPPESSPLQHLFGALMASPWVSPKVWPRYGLGPPARGKKALYSLILCNLVIKRSEFLSDPFPAHLTSNEENYFFRKCLESQMKLGAFPDLFLFHHRRPCWATFISQIRSYGQGRTEQWMMAPLRSAPLSLFPWLGVLLTLLTSVVFDSPWPLALVGGSYLAWVSSVGFVLHKKLQAKSVGFLLSVKSIVAYHGAYAWGGVLPFRPGFLVRPPKVRPQPTLSHPPSVLSLPS